MSEVISVERSRSIRQSFEIPSTEGMLSSSEGMPRRRSDTDIRKLNKVKFSDDISLHLVPSRNEMRKYGTGHIWWTQNDFDYFMHEARTEVMRAMQSRRVSHKEAKRILYQPGSGCDDLTSDRFSLAGVHKEVVVLASIVIYFAFTWATKYCKIF